MNKNNRSVARVWMQDRRVRMWVFAEVVRENVANDNCSPAEWCAQMSAVADAWKDRPAFAAMERNVREQVAAVRQANRPRAV